MKSGHLRGRDTLRSRQNGLVRISVLGAFTPRAMGVGVVGGRNGEGKSYAILLWCAFRVPNGLLSSHQARTIADLAERHARGVADITVRQNFQFHWVTIESLPEVLETLWRVGLSTTGACGDVVRNITGCPLAGFDAHEYCDASPLATELNGQLGGQLRVLQSAAQVQGVHYWLPFPGAPIPKINDVGLTAVTRKAFAW